MCFMLKRLLPILFLFCLLSFAGHANAGQMVLDGKVLAQDPGTLTIQKNVIVPIRPLLEELNYEITYDIQRGLLNAVKNDSKLELYLWNPRVLINGVEHVPQAAPQLIQGFTMMSAQDLAQLLKLTSIVNSDKEEVHFFSQPVMSREGVERHLLAADRQMMRAEYYNNQEFLNQCGIASSPRIVTKTDLQELLGMYWSERYIEYLWNEGSEKGKYIGFFSEGSIPLIYSKEIAVTYMDANTAIVEVKLPLWGDEGLTEFEHRAYTLVKDKQGRLLIESVKLI